MENKIGKERVWKSSGIWKRKRQIRKRWGKIVGGQGLAKQAWGGVGFLFVVQEFAWVERFLTIPCLLTNMTD